MLIKDLFTHIFSPLLYPSLFFLLNFFLPVMRPCVFLPLALPIISSSHPRSLTPWLSTISSMDRRKSPYGSADSMASAIAPPQWTPQVASSPSQWSSWSRARRRACCGTGARG
ncbi:hypothetical protein SEVIR_3G115050v4 [Setaria viridis]